MEAKRVKSRKTDKKGWCFRYTNPLTHARSWQTIWFQDYRNAEAGFREFMEGLEARAWNLPGKDGWKMPYTDAVTQFIQQAPITTEQRKQDLARVLNQNPLGLQVLADLNELGTLTAKCKKLVQDRGDGYTIRYVQKPLKQLSAWAASIGLLPHNPLGAWKLLPRTSQERHRRAFMPDEVRAILAAADEWDNIFGRTCPTSMVFKMLLVTGNRPRAILSATVADFDTDKQRIILPTANGKKRNGMAYLPPAFVSEMQRYLGRRGNLKPDDSLLASSEGSSGDRRNMSREFQRAMALAGVRKCWPTSDALALEADPLSVASLLFSGQQRGFDGAPPKDPKKLARRARHVQVTEALAARISAEVARFCERRDMYALRKTHISWARRLVNADSVKSQVGHAPQDIEERHYLDLVDARESALAVWDVLTGARSLSGQRMETEEQPIALAAGAENLHTLDSVADSGRNISTIRTGVAARSNAATSVALDTSEVYARRESNSQPPASEAGTLSN